MICAVNIVNVMNCLLQMIGCILYLLEFPWWFWIYCCSLRCILCPLNLKSYILHRIKWQRKKKRKRKRKNGKNKYAILATLFECCQCDELPIEYYRLWNVITRQCNDAFQLILWHSQYEFILFTAIVAIQWNRKPMRTFLLQWIQRNTD